MHIEDDSWRFSDATATKMNKTVGVYGCDLVPATTVRSSTGVARGEELFHRPELYRPWRGEKKQRSSEIIVEKEHEIEILTRSNNELRTETAALQRELQRALQRAKLAEQGQTEAQVREVRTLQETIANLQNQLESAKLSHENQFRALRSEHESEMKQQEVKVKIALDAANESGKLYARQLEEVKAAAAREVSLIQQLSQSRAAELQNELDATRDALRRLQERTAAMLADAQAETQRVEERCTAQLREQEMRLEKVRASLHSEIQALDAKADRHRTEAVDANEKAKAAEFELRESEARFKDWNVRLLADLDKLYEYYYAATKDIQGREHQVALVRNIDDLRSAESDSQKGVMERVAERLQHLAALKQQHALATESMQKKIRQLEASSTSASEMFRKSADEKDQQLTRLSSEVSGAKLRQERLEKALSELKTEAKEAQAALLTSAHRLQFHCDDLQVSLSHMGPNPVAPEGTIALVAHRVEEESILWEACAPAMHAGMTICQDILRCKMRQYAGYEFACDGGAILVAFQDPRNAARYALETQEWLCRARWPSELLQHHAGREEKAPGGEILFRGLRVATAIHYAQTESEETNVPAGVGIGRVNYFGKSVTQLLTVASFSLGGQIVISDPTWYALRESLDSIANPTYVELGQHRLTIPSRGERDALTTIETMILHQITPKSLAARAFKSEVAQENTVASMGVGIVPQFSALHRASIGAHSSALRSRQRTLARSVDTLTEETSTVAGLVTSLSCKVREAQVHGRIYTQADIVAHVAAIDRIVARTEVIRRDLDRVGTAHRETIAAVKALEDQVMLQTKIIMNEDEFKRKLELVNERANERLFEAKLQYEHQIQQLRNAVQKTENEAAELRKQLSSGNKSHVRSPMVSSQNEASKLPEMPTTDPKIVPLRPRPKSGRVHQAISDSKAGSKIETKGRK